MIRALIADSGLRGGTQRGERTQCATSAAGGQRLGKIWEDLGICDSHQERVGLVPACWDGGRAKWSRNVCAVTGRVLCGPSGRAGAFFGSVFSQQAVGADKSQESDRLPLCCAAHPGVLDHKSAER